ncbi:MAG: hypothetical protein KC469_12545 [Flavobacteriaceae bacterium]|nr:hypothetical protein [Flavobacteriaceae bacterium]
MKSVFPFSEPSHYALNIGGILLAAGLYQSAKIRLFIVLTVMTMGILFPSLILLVISFSLLIFYLFYTYHKTMVIGLFFIAGICVINIENMSYFTERLSFTSDSNNLTALVYLQGWQDMFTALVNTNGFGLGIQNISQLDPGSFGEKIYTLLGRYSNREDGGFLAAKLVSELGVLGIFLLFMYLLHFSRSVSFVMGFGRLSLLNRDLCVHAVPVGYVLGHCFIIMFFFELFARGYGYFSFGVFSFCMSLFVVRHIDSTLMLKNLRKMLYERQG